jgi:hypothetical protein
LGYQINNGLIELKQVFADICSISYPQDGVYFDLRTISAEEISETKDYAGVRLTITAHLDCIKQPLKIDIGFGDVLIGDPQILFYQTEIQGLESPKILAYSLETVMR